MPTLPELLRVLLLPLVVSAIIAGIGFWRNWRWANPLAAVAGFLAGVSTIHVPTLPPADGTDWLYWLMFPLLVFAIIDAVVGKFWGWVLGALAAVVSFVIARPLIASEAVTVGQALGLAAVLGGVGLLYTVLARLTQERLGAWAVGTALAIVLGASAVIVMSSGSRGVGLAGIAAAAAVGAAGVLGKSTWRGLPVVAAGLFAGLLTGGRLYADPGVSTLNFAVLAAAPILLLPAVIVPIKLVRGVVAVLLVAIAVAAVTAPTALKAKQASEEDPYAAYK